MLDSGRALVIAINKCDGLDPDQRDHNRSTLRRRLLFVPFAAQHFISAKHGTGVGEMMKSIDQAYASAFREFNTRYLTDLLEEAVFKHNPAAASRSSRQTALCSPGGRNPPIIVIHGNQTQHLPDVYMRYLTNFYIDKLKLKGTPLRIELKSGKNPYASKKGAKKAQEIVRSAGISADKFVIFLKFDSIRPKLWSMSLKRIIVTNAKGGCGKTTIATNIASNYALQGKAVRLFDHDAQGSSLAWIRMRPENRETDRRCRCLQKLRPPSDPFLAIKGSTGNRHRADRFARRN